MHTSEGCAAPVLAPAHVGTEEGKRVEEQRERKKKGGREGKRRDGVCPCLEVPAPSPGEPCQDGRGVAPKPRRRD